MSDSPPSRTRFAFVITGIAIAVATVLFVRAYETEEERNVRLCIENVRALLAAERSYYTGRNFIRYSGATQYLRITRVMETPDRPAVLRCPADPDVIRVVGASESARYDSAVLHEPETYTDLVSYAGRDMRRYPLPPEPPDTQWLICDRQGADGRTPHHADGIVVGFEDGSVRFLDREALGLRPGEPIIVGPDSPHPELRKMHFAQNFD